MRFAVTTFVALLLVLSTAIIGSVHMASANYYNPGGLLSANAETVQHIQRPDGFVNAPVAGPYVPLYPYIEFVKAEISWIKATIEAMEAAPIIR